MRKRWLPCNNPGRSTAFRPHCYTKPTLRKPFRPVGVTSVRCKKRGALWR